MGITLECSQKERRKGLWSSCKPETGVSVPQTDPEGTRGLLVTVIVHMQAVL